MQGVTVSSTVPTRIQQFSNTKEYCDKQYRMHLVRMKCILSMTAAFTLLEKRDLTSCGEIRRCYKIEVWLVLSHFGHITYEYTIYTGNEKI